MDGMTEQEVALVVREIIRLLQETLPGVTTVEIHSCPGDPPKRAYHN